MCLWERVGICYNNEIIMTKETRNKVLVPAVLLFGIFIGGVAVLQTKGTGASILTAGKKILFPIAAEPDADPDNDGLKNWEEELHKTDPRNPDTDEDGYVDGEEVASGYDPTVKAPGDALEGTDSSAPRPLPKNLTTHLSQLLTEKIAAGEFDPAQGDALDAAGDPSIPYNQDVLNEVLYQIGVRAKAYFTLPEIADADLRISSTPTTYQEIGIYIVAMSSALEPDDAVKDLSTNEVIVIKEAVETKDTALVELLRSSYQKAVERIKGVTVPKDFVQLHKQQLLILMQFEKIMAAVADFQNDPATASAAVEIYPQTVDMLEQFSSDLEAKIKSYQ